MDEFRHFNREIRQELRALWNGNIPRDLAMVAADHLNRNVVDALLHD